MSETNPEKTTVAKIAKLSGLSTRRIQQFAEKGQLPGAIRKSNSYHNEYYLTPELQRWAEKQHARSKKGNQPPPPGDRGQDNIHPHINRLVVFLGKAERVGMLDALDAEMLYELHKDLMPVIARYGRVVQRILEVEGESQDMSTQVDYDLRQEGLAIQLGVESTSK